MELTPCGYDIPNLHFTEDDFYDFCNYAIACAKAYENTSVYYGKGEDNDYTIFELVKIMYKRYSYIEKHTNNPEKIKIAKNNKEKLEHFVVSSINYNNNRSGTPRPTIVINVKDKKEIIDTYHKEHNIDIKYINGAHTKDEPQLNC